MKTWYISSPTAPNNHEVIRARDIQGAKAQYMRRRGYGVRLSPKTHMPVFTDADEAARGRACALWGKLLVKRPARVGKNPPLVAAEV